MILRRSLVNGSEQKSLTRFGKLGHHDYQTLKTAWFGNHEKRRHLSGRVKITTGESHLPKWRVLSKFIFQHWNYVHMLNSIPLIKGRRTLRNRCKSQKQLLSLILRKILKCITAKNGRRAVTHKTWTTAMCSTQLTYVTWRHAIHYIFPPP